MQKKYKNYTNKQNAEFSKKNYDHWKKESLKKKGYFIIFNGFLENSILSKISGGALKMYLFLGIHSNNRTGESYYSIKSMSQYFKKSERTISNWLNELEQLKLIERFQLEVNGVSHTFLSPYSNQ